MKLATCSRVFGLIAFSCFASFAPPAFGQSPVFDATGILSAPNQIIRLGTHSPTWRVQIEPVGYSFRIEKVIPASVVASYGGAQIHAIAWDRLLLANGDSHRVAVFAMSDLRRLFTGLGNGSTPVELTVTGEVTSTASFRAPVPVLVQKGSIFASSYGRAVPNPFNPSTTIGFDLASAGRLRLRVFDAAGRLVRDLADRQAEQGYHEVRWDGTAASGARVASGVYFYVLETPDGTTRDRLVLAR